MRRFEAEKVRVEIEKMEQEKERETTSTKSVGVAIVENRQQTINKTRAKANVLQAKNAEKMISRNDQLLGKVCIGDSVVFFSSEFDRGLADPPNILCKVIDIDSHKNYQLACAVGILDKYMARNAFQIIQETIDFQVSRDKMVSPREAVRLLSIGNGQGFVICDCTGQCKTRRCGCFKMSLKCKSRCHGSNINCINKE